MAIDHPLMQQLADLSTPMVDIDFGTSKTSEDLQRIETNACLGHNAPSDTRYSPSGRDSRRRTLVYETIIVAGIVAR